MENSCVVCGCYIPEGDHVCKFCRISENTEYAIRLEIPPNIISIDTMVTPIQFRVETTSELMVQLAKYYIFKTNMDSNGTFNYKFIMCNLKWLNIQKHEDLLSCEARLTDEYNRTVELIESMIIKK